MLRHKSSDYYFFHFSKLGLNVWENSIISQIFFDFAVVFENVGIKVSIFQAIWPD